MYCIKQTVLGSQILTAIMRPATMHKPIPYYFMSMHFLKTFNINGKLATRSGTSDLNSINATLPYDGIDAIYDYSTVTKFSFGHVAVSHA